MSFDPQSQQAIAAHMQYLRDLGIFEFYRRDTLVVIEPTPQEPLIPYVIPSPRSRLLAPLLLLQAVSKPCARSNPKSATASVAR